MQHGPLFHTFETEVCAAGFQFAADGEARQFLKKMNERDKIASKATHETLFTKPAKAFAALDAYDPKWRENFGDYLQSKGLSDEYIRENQAFIIDFMFLQKDQAKQR